MNRHTAPGAPVPPHVRRALDRLDPDNGTWITVTADEAVRQARVAPDGRLAGLTFAVKDLIDTAGVRTTYGSPLYRDHVPAVTASVVTRLERQGAVSVGKTNLNEFAYGVTGYNPTYGLIRSPLDPAVTAGGSSGGSAAAVGEGVVDFAVGTDTSGSVRIPAACCGVVGFKCAHGSQPMDGVYPLAPSMDCPGYLARDVATLQRILGIGHLPPAGTVVARDADELDLPALPEEHWVVFRAQSYPLHRERSLLHPDAYGRDLHLKLSLRDTLPAEAAWARALAWRREYAAACAGVDVVSGPVFDGPPPRVDDVLAEYAEDSLHTSARLMARTAVASALGWPAMAVPTDRGVVQLAARPGHEPALLAHAARIAAPPANRTLDRTEGNP